MKIKRRLCALLLAALTVMLSAAGCSDPEGAASGSPGATASPTAEAPETSVPPTAPETAEPSAVPEVTEPPATPEVTDPPAAPTAAESPAVPEPPAATEPPQELMDEAFTDKVDVDCGDLGDESAALAGSTPAVPTYLKTSAPGISVKSNSKAVIDYSNVRDGYVMVRYTASTTQRLKALVQGPTTQYRYNLTPGQWATLPLSDGNGTYQVGVYENVRDTSYAAVVTQTISAAMTDEFAPFLRSNQYVDFESAPNTIARAAELCAGIADPLEKVKAVYAFVVGNLTYDRQLAATVKSGYLPVLDTVLAKRSGICFDYAALMTGMLRSQGVPCKLVVGYAGTAYHAWISVWSAENGWINGAIYFDGTSWQRMDPTFASSGNQSDSIMQYIGNSANYSAKYFY